MTTSLLFQTIDQLSREKGIDPQIIIAAVEDAVLVATRKYYKSSEELQSHFNKATGQVEVHAVKKVVEHVQDPDHEIGLEAGAEDTIRWRSWRARCEFPKPRMCWGGLRRRLRSR